MVDLLASVCVHAKAYKRTCRVSTSTPAFLLGTFGRVSQYAARRARMSLLQRILHLNIGKSHSQKKYYQLSLG